MVFFRVEQKHQHSFCARRGKLAQGLHICAHDLTTEVFDALHIGADDIEAF
jgi:hypothetical protein